MKSKLQFLVVLTLFFSGSRSLATQFTYEDLVQSIQSKGTRSVEEALDLFPKDMLSHFVLMFDSLSLQKSDGLHPRAIFFQSDAKLVCSFGGHKALAGYDSLECYQYRNETRSFDFREIVFPDSRNKLKEVVFSLPNQQAVGSMKCTSCHGQDPRPNWEPYSTWAGAFGSRDDNFVRPSWTYYPSEAGQRETLAINQELNAFKSFKRSYQKSPRYRKLEFNSTELLAPFKAEEKYGNLQNRPNFHLTAAITQLVAQRNARLLESRTDAERIHFLMGLGKCEKESLEAILSKMFAKFDWQPAFRSYQDAEKRGNGISRYQYLDGLTELNRYVAFYILKDLTDRKLLSSNVLNDSTVTFGTWNPGYTPELYRPFVNNQFVVPEKIAEHCSSLSEAFHREQSTAETKSR